MFQPKTYLYYTKDGVIKSKEHPMFFCAIHQQPWAIPYAMEIDNEAWTVFLTGLITAFQEAKK